MIAAKTLREKMEEMKEERRIQREEATRKFIDDCIEPIVIEEAKEGRRIVVINPTLFTDEIDLDFLVIYLQQFGYEISKESCTNVIEIRW